MNSSKSKRTRRKVILHCHKLNSSNRSHLSSCGTAGSCKLQIRSLLKNNKMLAVTLEDVRCELSTTKNYLDEAVGHLNRIKIARLKMIQMQSVLSSFVKDFDETLLILKYDDFKWPEFGVPTRLHKNFKNNMGKVSESVEKSFDCVSANGAIVNRDETSSVHVTSSICNTSNAFHNEIVNQPVEDSIMKDINSNQAENVDLMPEVHLPPVTYSEDSEGTKEKEENASKFETPLKNDESLSTPKLNISMQTTADLESSKLKSNFSHERCLSQTITVSKNSPILSIVLSSQKPQVSKIPRFQDLTDKVKRPIEFIKKSNEKTTKKRKFVEKSDSNSCRRKTFVVKNSEILSNDKSCTTFNRDFSNPKKEVFNENILDAGNLVLKPSDIQEDVTNSKRDRRKTFVKQADNHSISVLNKRNTFVASELPSITPVNHENINCFENCNIVHDVAVINDKDVTDVQLHANDSALNFHSSKENFITTECSDEVNHVVDNSADVNISKLYSEVPRNDINLIPGEPKEVSIVSENLESGASVDVHKNENEIKEEENKIMDTNVLFNKNLSKVIDNVEVIDISNNTNNTRSRKRVSYKLFLDSSGSEDETIPVDDISFVKEIQSSIKTTPIRRHISKGKDKKVFVFGETKRKSIISKRPSSKKSKISPNGSKKIRKSNVTNIVDIKDQKSGKTVKFAINEQVCESSLKDNNHLHSCKNKPKNLTIPINTENCATSKKEYKSSDSIIKDSKDMLNDVDNRDINNVAGPSGLHYKKHENMIHYTMDDTSYKSIEVSGDVEKKATKKQKAGKVKQNHNQPKDNIILDDFSVTNKSKKINLEEGKIISEVIAEDDLNNVAKEKNLKVKVKKQKAENKVRNELPYKKTGKNTFLVHAEVHPPPPSSLNELEIEDLNKENEEILKLKNFQVSIVLKDVFKSENSNKLNILCEKDLLPSKNIPQKTPFLENSHNILLMQEKSAANVPENVEYSPKNSEDIIRPRRQRVKRIYKEPSLNRKLRR